MISVILPTYQRNEYLSAALESVLSQTHRDCEVLVLDDSQDGQAEVVVREYADRFDSIRYFWTNFGNVAKARNLGIANARGDVIAFLDDDDRWCDEKLEKSIRLMETSGANVVFTGLKNVSEGLGSSWVSLPGYAGYFYPHSEARLSFSGMLRGEVVKKYALFCGPHPFVLSTLMVKKSVLDEVGCFDESLEFDEDLELYIRMASTQRFDVIREALVIKIDVLDSITHNTRGVSNSKFQNTGRPLLDERHGQYLNSTIRALRAVRFLKYWLLPRRLRRLTARFYPIRMIRP